MLVGVEDRIVVFTGALISMHYLMLWEHVCAQMLLTLQLDLQTSWGVAHIIQMIVGDCLKMAPT